MNLWFRLLFDLFTMRFREKVSWQQVGKRTFRVWPSDLDIFRHMNNGVFLSLLDLGRYDLAMRSGIWQQWKKLGWYPVVVAETITFRKSLMPWQKFVLESKVIGWDDQAVYFEQRFVVGEEIYTKAFVRIRFLKRARGIVTPAEVVAQLGGWQGPQPVLPQWLKLWADQTALPKVKEPAKNIWEI
jgi:acyl-CoA thioesterase FadM